MTAKKAGASLLIVLTALIWGAAFVAQSVGMRYVGPFTFNAVRRLLGVRAYAGYFAAGACAKESARRTCKT